MKRRYLEEDVYTAFLERMRYVFEEFDNIFVSFSGGKDSGLLLEMVLDFQKKYYPHKTIGVYHQDFEAQYSVTTEYIERTFKRLEGENTELYWVCLPAATRTALSNYEMYWYPWDDTKEEMWVRKMPEHPYVINLNNNPITTYTYRMHQEDLARRFGRWYKLSHGNKKTVCLLGMRAEESLNRYNSFLNKRYGYKGQCWISRQYKDVCTASPMYDWMLSDVWCANYRFGYDYNRLYDMFYRAGLRADQMRVASPFNDYAKEGLNLYRVLDPETWTRLVGRVNGVNFGAIYGKTKALGYRNLTLPKGHTWESYTKFLLDTLPYSLRKNYERIFNTSIKFWRETGGGLTDEAIEELRSHGYNVQINGVSNYTKSKLKRVVFVGDIPDDTDDIKSTKDIPSWKRMCYCILKNDHNCRFMGFGLTREQQNHIAALKEKYSRIGDEDEL